ncbi:LysR family transcriptional regulator [Microlunatus speluncae]|uniref:LysR family transcriptional regulator n=1 Tax=Microlunatus speluncae TaxID=2594267 RepID=UPI0012660AC8|nr:LysR family transcriptional regulator [Microlunatus speluncae]
MDVRLLRSFLAVVEDGTVGGAAGRLSLSQPALTKQLQALERQLGGTLFRRGRHGAVLTDFGSALLPDARDLVARTDALSRRAGRAARGELGRIRVGFGLSSIEYAPHAVAAFRRRHPDVQVSLEDLPSRVQLDRIRSGDLHVGFVRLPERPELPYRFLGVDRLAVAVGPDADPPDRAGWPAWLAGQPVVRLVPTRGPGLAAQIERLRAAWAIGLNVIQETADLQTVLALVAAGVGTALVPASGRGIAPAGVRLITLDDPMAAWRVGAVWRAEEPVAHRFVELLEADHPEHTGPMS